MHQNRPSFNQKETRNSKEEEIKKKKRKKKKGWVGGCVFSFNQEKIKEETDHSQTYLFRSYASSVCEERVIRYRVLYQITLFFFLSSFSFFSLLEHIRVLEGGKCFYLSIQVDISINQRCMVNIGGNGRFPTRTQ